MRWKPRSIAVTGASGQLGKELCRQLGSAAVSLPRREFDITRREAVRGVLAELRPHTVINCAAWTAVDRAEQEADACFLANATAVGWLAEACEEVDALLVQVSTDYVFGADRTRQIPYREHDATGPLNTYGASKCAGEDAARMNDNHVIVRTCGLYSAGDAGPVRGRNFLDTMLALAESRTDVSVVNDQHCTPSYVPHVAAGILALMANEGRGTFHVTNGGATTWHAVAEALFALAGRAVAVRPIASRDYPSPVERPAYSVLDATKFTNATATELPSWRHGVADYVHAIKGMTPRSG